MHSWRSRLYYGVGLTELVCLLDVSCPSGLRVEDVDNTHLLSVGLVSNWQPGIRHAGDIAFRFIYNKIDAAAMYSHAISGDIIPWRVVLPDLSIWDAVGYINALTPAAVPEDGQIQGSVTVRLNGAPTFTPS